MTLEEIYGNAKALVEDKTYQIGEISEKTGLQKTANGWVKPKNQNNTTSSKQEEKASPQPQKETNKENGPKENSVEKKTNKKPSIQEYMKAKDLMKKHEAQYKKEMDDYEYMERLKANGVNTSIFNPMFGGKPQPLENRSSYKEAMETVKSYETNDSACRITADTKIKLKK